MTHRDGNGEILFAAGDEYHQMQTAVTYEHGVIEEDWSGVLQGLTGPGIVLADLTSLWTEFLKRKRDSDLTG
ncbi:MAG: hypothetical protein ACK5YE_20345, partial [Planctomyces sp.]